MQCVECDQLLQSLCRYPRRIAAGVVCADMIERGHGACVRLYVGWHREAIDSSALCNALIAYGDADLICDMVERGLRFADSPQTWAGVRRRGQDVIKAIRWGIVR